MGCYLLEDFIKSMGERAPGQENFELERDHLLRVNLRGAVWTRIGSMVAYTGNIRFAREEALEHGISRKVKISLAGEGISFIKAEGVESFSLQIEERKSQF